jgi:hydrogenase maturation protease
VVEARSAEVRNPQPVALPRLISINARVVYGRVPEDVLVTDRDSGAVEMADRIAGSDRAILLDAAVSGEPPGRVHRVGCAVIPTTRVASSHGQGVAEAMALARNLGCLLGRA